ncbi:hypothetical protein QBC47DRAFT_385735 [Echria macrotheca]|uniref:Uncharacterized protein n=1 Tax=Echria macrotheca TaxID=438768 RepID=A0AAJ0BDZ1_9PEZI|nr:hypothetical protein QBC47DRAFT_385735 [Echria macrotheca]
MSTSDHQLPIIQPSIDPDTSHRPAFPKPGVIPACKTRTEVEAWVKTQAHKDGHSACILTRRDRYIRWYCGNHWSRNSSNPTDGQQPCPPRWVTKQTGETWVTVLDRDTRQYRPASLPISISRVHVMWFGVPEGQRALSADDTVCIPFILESEGTIHSYKDVIDKAHKLMNQLGKSFIHHNKKTNQLLVHQSVVTMLLADRHKSLDIDFYPWSWVIENIRTGSLQTQILGKERVIVAPVSTISTVPGLTLQEFYDRLNPVLGMRNNVLFFPSRREHEFETDKIFAIRTMDEIAELQREKGIEKYAYRPRTCFGLGKCTLADLPDNAKVVLKRSCSSASEHVIITTAADRTRLRCSREDATELLGSQDGSEYWIHQEYVEELQSIGEFRVFVCADDTRVHYNGKVISIAHTKPTKKKGRVAVHWASSSSLHRIVGNEADNKLEELRQLALLIYREMRSRNDERFGSLEVGARIDCGIKQRQSDWVWFGNEVTFPLEADQFPQAHLPYPHTLVAEAMANSFIKYALTRWK